MSKGLSLASYYVLTSAKKRTQTNHKTYKAISSTFPVTRLLGYSFFVTA